MLYVAPSCLSALSLNWAPVVVCTHGAAWLDTAFCVQWHASYEALKETLLHELAHWAAYHHCGHWQHLGQSEVATSGHGDYWLREVRRIQVRAALLPSPISYVIVLPSGTCYHAQAFLVRNKPDSSSELVATFGTLGWCSLE